MKFDITNWTENNEEINRREKSFTEKYFSPKRLMVFDISTGENISYLELINQIYRGEKIQHNLELVKNFITSLPETLKNMELDHKSLIQACFVNRNQMATLIDALNKDIEREKKYNEKVTQMLEKALNI